MGKNKTKILLSLSFLALLIVLSVFFFNLQRTEKVEAGAGDNVFGWAWSENIGWISFNSTSGGGGIDYGVNIDQVTGIFSGYAWSENIGWISFNQSELSGCPSGVCRAEVDLLSQEVSGWAKALAYGDGWEGWIRLRGSNYGVKINDVSQEFEGWAWGDDVVGWVSFNCNNPETGDICSASDYKVKTSFVFNQPPRVESLEIQYEEYCSIFTGQGLIGFKWIYQDEDNDNESRFDFRVNDINNVNDPNPEIDRTFEGLNNPSGTANNQSVLIKSPLESDKVTFNKTYYWWARVWDDKGNNSGWVAGPSITTDSHAWPYPDFTWSPSSPSVDEITQFCAVQETDVCPINESSCYDAANNLISCSGKTFFWTFPSGTEFATGTSATSENPRVKFDSTGQKVVSLQITDDLGTCSITKQVGVTFPLPEWEEAAP
jgi:hypothetical protein